MTQFLFLAGFLVALATTSSPAQTTFAVRTVAADLVIPWEMEFGPDGTLWTTERIGVMSRINIETGEKKIILDKRDEVFTKQETGMLGFTWHPDFENEPYVYISYVGGFEENLFRVVERYTYRNDTLVEPLELFRLQPADIYHQGCRLNILPDGKLYVTMGDSPGGTDPTADSTVIGKILRMNLDGSVPDDNPVPGNLLYTKGHRNVQGFVQIPNGNIWTAEHGNIIEDEVNMLVPNGNYGWPYVEGVCDEEWETEYCDTSDAIEPKWSSGQTTVAPCALDYYNDERYPSLANSLLMCTLKNGTLFQLVLNDDGNKVIEEKQHINRSIGRLRDVAIHPDGRLFVCTSNQEPLGYFPFPKFHDDRIVEIVPVEDCDGPVAEFSEVTNVRGLVGDSYRFGAPFKNTGDCAITITGMWDITEDSPFNRDQWRVPVVIPPGETYDLAVIYTPTEEAPDSGRVGILTHELGTFEMTFVGSTSTGLLETEEDTVVILGAVGITVTLDIEFANTGNDTLRITGVGVAGTDKDRFTAMVDEGLVLAPNESTMCAVRYTPNDIGVDLAQLEIYSTGYKTQRILLVGDVPTASVDHDQNQAPALHVYPNPVTSTSTIVVPETFVRGTLTITNMVGEVLFTQPLNGQRIVDWTGMSNSGTPVATGSYMVSIVSETGIQSTVVQVHRQ